MSSKEIMRTCAYSLTFMVLFGLVLSLGFNVGANIGWEITGMSVIEPNLSLTYNVLYESEQLSYSGYWLETVNQDYSEGKALFSNNKDDNLIFTFNGTNLYLLASSRPDLGRVNVSIDGIIYSINLYSENTENNRLFLVEKNLFEKEHDVVVTVAENKYVLLDAFMVEDENVESLGDDAGESYVVEDNGSDAVSGEDVVLEDNLSFEDNLSLEDDVLEDYVPDPSIEIVIDENLTESFIDKGEDDVYILDSTAAYNVYIQYEYDATPGVWTTSCSSPGNTVNCNVGTEANPLYCTQEGYVDVRAVSNCEVQGWSYAYTNGDNIYHINWDSDEKDCVCYGKQWFGQNYTDGTAPSCCGDDGVSDNFYYWNDSSDMCKYCNAGVVGIATCYDEGTVAGNVCYYDEACRSDGANTSCTAGEDHTVKYGVCAEGDITDSYADCEQVDHSGTNDRCLFNSTDACGEDDTGWDVSIDTDINSFSCTNCGNASGFGFEYSDAANACYFNVSCTIQGWNGTNESCPDHCLDDNDGGDCALSEHNLDLDNSQTCYYNDICDANLGCNLTMSGTVSAGYCDICNATGFYLGNEVHQVNTSCLSGCPESGLLWYDNGSTPNVRSDDCNGIYSKIVNTTYQFGFVFDNASGAYCQGIECNADCNAASSDQGFCASNTCYCINVTKLVAINITPTRGAFGTMVNVTSVNATPGQGTNVSLFCGNESGLSNLCNSTFMVPEVNCSFISPWLDDALHTIYCYAQDNYSQSVVRSRDFFSDNTAPLYVTLLNVDGDDTYPYFDSSNNNITLIQINMNESDIRCRWSEADINYDNISSADECTVVGSVVSCDVNKSILFQTNITARHIACEDRYGNDQNVSDNADIVFGVDWTRPAVYTNNDGMIHAPGYQVVFTEFDIPENTSIYTYYCNDTNGSCTPSTSIDDGENVTFNIRGTWYLKWNASDDAGNLNTTGQTVVFINHLINHSGLGIINHPGHIFEINISAGDVDTSQNISCILYFKINNTAGDYANRSMLLKSGVLFNGTFSANISTQDGYNFSDQIAVYASCFDGVETVNSSAYVHQIFNNAPVNNDTLPTINWPEDTVNSGLNLSQYFTDLDQDDLNYSFSQPDNISVFIDNNTGIVTFIPDANFSGIAYVNFTAYDAFGGNATSNVSSLNVTPVNDAPILNATIPDWAWPEDLINDSLNLTIYSFDIDGDDINYSFSQPDNISVFIDNNTGIVIFIPYANFSGIAYITFTAFDPYGENSSSNVVMLNVTPVNDLPVFNASLTIPNITMDEDTSDLSINLNLYFFDVDGDHLNYSALDVLNISVTIDNLSGIVNITPWPNFNGFRNVTFYAYDPDGENATSNIVFIEVIPVPDCGDTLLNDTFLTEDLVNTTNGSICPGTAFFIGTDNITLDCNGYNINGSAGSGLEIYGRNNITLINCTFTGFDVGINVTDSNNTFIANNTVSNGSLCYYVSEDSRDSLLQDNLAINCVVGYDIHGNNTYLYDNVGDNASFVLDSANDYRNVLVNNTAFDSEQCFVLRSDNNELYNNTGRNCIIGFRIESDNNLLESNDAYDDHIGISVERNNNDVYANLLWNNSFGIFINHSSGNDVRENILRDIINDAIYVNSSSGVYVSDNILERTFGNDLVVGFNFSNNVSQNTLKLGLVADHGLINYSSNVSLDYGLDLGQFLEISDNLIFVNSSFAADSGLDLNESALLLLSKLNFADAKIQIDDGYGWQDCPPSVCTKIDYAYGNLLFNVTRFSAYKAAAAMQLLIWDDTDNITKYVNDSVWFYASFINFTNSSINGTGSNCEIRFNFTGAYSISYAMEFNSSLSVYQYNATVPVKPLSYYEVVCNGSGQGYGVIFDVDEINITNRNPVVASNISDIYLNSNETYLGSSLYDHFTDPDNDNLTFILNANHSGLSFSFNYLGNFTINGSAGNYSANITAYDNEDGSVISNQFLVNVSYVPVCGNGIREPAEQCDLGDLGGATCPSGYTGNVVCSSSCTLVYSGCVEISSPPSGGGGGGGIVGPGPIAPAPPAPVAPVAPSVAAPAPTVAAATVSRPAVSGMGFFNIGCVNVTRQEYSKPIVLIGGKEIGDIKIPDGYDIIINPFNLECDGDSLDISLNIPENYVDVQALRCTNGVCGNVYLEEIEQLVCGSEVFDVSRQRTYLTPEDMDVEIINVSSTDESAHSEGFSLEFLDHVSPDIEIKLSMPNSSILNPSNPGLKIVGTPAVFEILGYADSRAKIVMPYMFDSQVQAESVAIYYLKSGEWYVLDTKYDGESYIAEIENISDALEDNKALFAEIGLVSYVAEARLEKVHDPEFGSRDALFMLHGLASSPKVYDDIITDIKYTNQPWQAWTFSYPTADSIKVNAAYFADLLQSHVNEYDNIYIAAHSLGGLIAQQALWDAYKERDKYSFVDKVRRVVLVGVPTGGTPSAGVYQALAKYVTNVETESKVFALNTKSIDELVQGIDVPRVPSVEYFVIAGTRGYEIPGILSSSELFGFDERNDGVLTVRSAQKVGGDYLNDSCKNYWELDVPHTQLIDNPSSRRVLERIIAEEILAKHQGEAVLGYNQILKLNINSCSPEDQFIVIGKKISYDEVYDPTGCACGNGVCGIGESEINCPTDCADFEVFEYLNLFVPIVVAMLTILMGLALVARAYKRIFFDKHSRFFVYLFYMMLVAVFTYGLYFAAEDIFNEKVIVAAFAGSVLYIAFKFMSSGLSALWKSLLFKEHKILRVSSVSLAYLSIILTVAYMYLYHQQVFLGTVLGMLIAALPLFLSSMFRTHTSEVTKGEVVKLEEPKPEKIKVQSLEPVFEKKNVFISIKEKLNNSVMRVFSSIGFFRQRAEQKLSIVETLKIKQFIFDKLSLGIEKKQLSQELSDKFGKQFVKSSKVLIKSAKEDFVREIMLIWYNMKAQNLKLLMQHMVVPDIEKEALKQKLMQKWPKALVEMDFRLLTPTDRKALGKIMNYINRLLDSGFTESRIIESISDKWELFMPDANYHELNKEERFMLNQLKVNAISILEFESRNKEKVEALRMFVKEAKEKGHSPELIETVLVKKGWPKRLVRAVIEEYFR